MSHNAILCVLSLYNPSHCILLYLFFFLNDPATPEIYTLPLHAALPISTNGGQTFTRRTALPGTPQSATGGEGVPAEDRKSTRLNSSHANISYAVFCLKKKKKRRAVSSHNGLCLTLRSMSDIRSEVAVIR